MDVFNKNQKELISLEKSRLIKLYQENFKCITKEEILKMLYKFERLNDLTLYKEDFDELEFELLKIYCRNCGAFCLIRH